MPSNTNQQAYPKDFENWSEIKPDIHSKDKVPLFQEKQIWWCSVGVNIGYEIDGKNGINSTTKLFTRPVLIYKKLGHYTFLGIPLTSKQKNGSWFHQIDLKNKKSTLIFSQIRMFDAKRLTNRIEKLSDSQFVLIQKALGKFLDK